MSHAATLGNETISTATEPDCLVCAHVTLRPMDDPLSDAPARLILWRRCGPSADR